MATTGESIPVRGEGLVRALGAVSALARELRHPHLADGLDAEAATLDRGRTRVVFLGEFGAGRSAVVNGLLGAPVCGVSAVRSTTVATVVRFGEQPRAWSCTQEPDGVGRREVPLAEVASLSLADPEPGLQPSAATGWLEVELPRRMLAGGMELVDLPGLGGGMAAPQAATLLRTLEDADIAVYVADAATELTTVDLDLLTEAAATCPSLACVLTRTDLHPHWRRIADIDRRHLADAGLDVPVVPVSAPLRALALSTGDPALHAESGFAVLAAMLDGRLRASRREADRRRATGLALDSLARLQQHLAAERAALRTGDPDVVAAVTSGGPDGGTDPEATAQLPVLPSLKAREERARTLIDSASRWRELLADRVGEARRTMHVDLVERRRRVRDELSAELEELDPAAEWGEFVPWMTALLNQQLVEHRRTLLAARARIAQTVAERLDLDAASPHGDGAMPLLLPDAGSGVAQLDLPALGSKPMTAVDLTMSAARGLALGGSVGGISMTLLSHAVAATAMAAVAGVALPVLVGLAGVTFAYRSVRGAKDAALLNSRAEARRLALAAAEEAFTDAAAADEDALARSYELLRDHFGVIAQRVHLSALASLDAATEALQVHGQRAGERLAEVEELQRRAAAWSQLLGAALAELAPATGAPQPIGQGAGR